MGQATSFLKWKNSIRGVIRRVEGAVYHNFVHKTKPILDGTLAHLSSSFISRPIVILSVCGFAGSYFAFSFPTDLGLVLCILLLVFLLAVSSHSSREDPTRLCRITLTFILGTIFMLYCFSYVSFRKSAADTCMRMGDDSVRSVYDEFNGRVQSVQEFTSGYQTFVMEQDNGALVLFGGREVSLSEGDRVSVLGSMMKIEQSNNPGGFSRYDFYSRKGIYLEVSTYDNCIQVVDKGSGIQSVWKYVSVFGQYLRNRLGEAWEIVLSKEDAGLLMAMLLGDTSNVSSDLKSDFRLLNLSHLTAVSGANIAFFMMPASGAVRIITGKRRTRGAILILFLLFLGFLTGWSASVSRAIFVAVTHILSDLSARRHCPICAICAASLLMIFLNPFTAVDIGFCLSASAALALILLSDSAVSCLTGIGLSRQIASLIGPVICAHIGMLPWMVYLSGRESVFLLLVNILGSFLAEGISIFGLIASPFLAFPLLFRTSWPAILFFSPVNGLLFLLRELAERSVTFGLHAFQLRSTHPVLLIAVSSLFLVLLIPKSYVKRILSAVSVFLLSVGLILQVSLLPQQPVATVIFSDVGQGDACLILLQDGRSVLIDAGSEREGERVLLPMLNYFGIEKIDLCILTHLHQDHGGGLIPLVRDKRVSDIFTPYQTTGSELSQLFFLCDTSNVQIHTIEKDDRIVLSEEMTIDVLLPETITENGGNADSAVLFLTIQGTGILLMGDAGFEQETLLSTDIVSDKISQETDILKVGHHGSKYSTGTDFLSYICAESAVISVGENSYGHPSDDTLDRLKDSDMMTFRTDWSGAVIIQIYSDQYQIQTSLAA